MSSEFSLCTKKNETPQHLRSLNSPQREAVEYLDGPLLILAGAGTGKTRVLVHRINHIFFEGKAWPSEVLAVTFTNKAASEMRTRVTDHSGQMASGLWLGTFHSISAKILRRHAKLLGYSERFNIIDTDDQLRLIRQILKDTNQAHSKELCKQFLGFIESWKDRGLVPEKVTLSHLISEVHEQALDIYKIYQQRLLALDAMDFGDLILNNLVLFQRYTDVLKDYQERFKYILVDEYQDTNVAQYLWVSILAQKHRNLCCVGDDDQSIYGWRGAEVANILRFEKDFQGAKVIRLEQNYRSTHHILSAASALIAKNQQRLGKTLWTDEREGEKVHVKSTWDAREEARWIAEEIENLQRQKIDLSSIAILVRAGFQTREFEECFLQMGIAHRIIGGFRFYERQEIRDVLAYLRLIAHDKDGLAFERIINVPKRGIGTATLQKIHLFSREKNCSFSDAARVLLEEGQLKGKGAEKLKEFFTQLDKWRDFSSNNTLPDLVSHVVKSSGYMDYWNKQNTLESRGRTENVQELVRAVKDYETLEEFLEHVSLVMENTQGFDKSNVTIMTIHSAKGLEFDYVFLAGWEEGVFPSERSRQANDLEEERRLAYVGLTRARKKAFISFALNRYFFGQWSSNPPSRFIRDLPQENIIELPSSFQRLKGDMPTITPTSHKKFSVGERVFHIKFGYGYVTYISGEQVDVTFEHTGPKKILEGFLKKTN
ncbi:MAG: DNA helicase II [Rickettsiales bacterium]|nr:DNA helicase II [Rickettsiales bacterium]|tara:strand:+ start:28898 stop:31039 length:2142 start_codon:yes stop_codon:yes gene_type:complete